MRRRSWYRRVKNGLAAAAQTILAAPLKLPPKVVAGARYVALLIGLLDALATKAPDEQPAGSKEEPPDE